MADLILKQIWNWLSAGWSNMADLADRIDDLICSFEGGAETTMDTVAMLIFGWMIFGLFVLAIGRYIYGRFISSSESKEKTPAPQVAAIAAAPSVSEDVAVAKELPRATVAAAPRTAGTPVPPTPPIRKRISSKKGGGPTPSPARTTSYVQPPIATGPESESVQWVNDVFTWLYSDFVIVNEILNTWIQALNEYTKQSVTETEGSTGHSKEIKVIRKCHLACV
ncbi:hypothetical protein C0J52_23639 [Blattella germanica]|nr:hypothetical protein C0J52_23639 [Blattella germanica]